MPWPTSAASVIFTIDASWYPRSAKTVLAASSRRRRVRSPRFERTSVDPGGGLRVHRVTPAAPARSSSFRDLPHGRPRQRVDERERLRHLEAREPLAAMVAELLLRRRGAVVEDDERGTCLTPALVGDADDGGLEHGLVGREDVLDLRRIDVLAPRDDHVLDPSGDPVELLPTRSATSPVSSQPSGRRRRWPPGCASSPRRRWGRGRRARRCPRPRRVFRSRRHGGPRRRADTACRRSQACAARPPAEGRGRSGRPR